MATATTTTVPITDHLQHSNHEIQIPPNTTINSVINDINNDKSLLLLPDEDENVVVTVAQFPIANPPVAPFTPSPNSSSISTLNGKRKRMKPDKYNPSLIKKEKKNIVTPKRKVKRDTSASSSLGNKKNRSKEILDPAQISATMFRAGEIQASLGNEYPSFCKMMVRSHVTKCFWMGLPFPFCKSYLPQQESPIVVIDEKGDEHIIKYIAYRFGFSAGWKTFAVGHNLHEGDVLIFQLVGPCKFKVYIVRTNTSNVVDSAIDLSKDTGSNEHRTSDLPKMVDATQEISTPEPKQKGRKRKTDSESNGSKSTVLKSKGRKCKADTKPKGRKPSTSRSLSMVKNKQPMEHSAVGPEVLEGSEEIRFDYYNLCVAKNELLHDGVLEGVYYKLVAGMIGETVSIANMIKNCKFITKKEQFDIWDSSLKSFEIMGMKVGFLRKRIRALVTLMFESEEAKRCAEAKEEKNKNAQEIKNLEAKVTELYESNRKIDVFLGGLKEKIEGYEVEFKKKVNEPW
ncbi:B3 domain-containing protein Os01g0234100-like isoform X2 [Rutidosis leptorrhynchoides]|uniref:B3 domain-containing protein Os01g0234100-like isoform X2 n=1 Tax=Rutidosis leptorrhynchoides TaxID=125765 RepID=UPI003A997130